MITVSTPAAIQNLTIIPTVKTELELTADESDEILEKLIADASASIATFCERAGHDQAGKPYNGFSRQVYQETVRAYGGNYLMLTNTPIVSVATVLMDSSPITDYVIEKPGAGILYRKAGWSSTHQVGWGMTSYRLSRSEEPTYVITYTAGYLLPGETNRTLPADIERACIETVKAWYRSRSSDPAVQSKRVGDLAITYSNPNANGQDFYALPLDAIALLKPYRRVV